MSPAYLNNIVECELHIRRWIGDLDRMREISPLIRNEEELRGRKRNIRNLQKFTKN